MREGVALHSPPGESGRPDRYLSQVILQIFEFLHKMHQQHFQMYCVQSASLECNVISQRDDITNDVITCAHVAGHVTF